MHGMALETRTKVLLVDDEKMLLELYRKKFELNNCDVYTCVDAESALAVLRYGYKPDIILFDITMEGMGGYAFIEAVNKEKLGAAGCLYIALTNEGQEGEIQRVKELGAYEHILKAQYTPAEMVAHVLQKLKEKDGKTS